MPFSSFPAIICKIAYANAPIHFVIAAALAQHLAANAAGALPYANMPLILFQPIRNMLQINCAILHGNCLFHWNDMHPNASPSWWDHMGNAIQRDKCHALKKARQRRMLPKAFIPLWAFLHIKQLCRARHKHWQAVPTVRRPWYRAIMVIIIAIIILQKPNIAHFIQNFLKMCLLPLLYLVHFPQLFYLIMAAHLHAQRNIRHLFCDNLSQPPIFWVCHRNAFDFVLCHVCDLPSKL